MIGKKRTALKGAFVVACAMGLAVAAPASAQDYSFLFAGAYDEALYPEYDYSTHPSILGKVPSTFVVVDGSVDFDLTENTATRLDAALGLKGGTSVKRALSLLGDLGADYYMQSDTGTLGFGLHGDGDYSSSVTELDDYANPSQRSVETLTSLPLVFGAFAVKTLASKEFSQGYSFTYDFAMTPAYYSWVNDASQSPALVYSPAVGSDKDTYKHSAALRGDWSLPLGDIDLKLSAAYDFAYTDCNTQYVCADTDLDGYKDTKYTREAWVELEAVKGGPADGETGLTDQDMTFSHEVDLGILVTVPLADSLDMLLGARYVPFYMSVREYYVRTISAAVPTNDSWDSQTYMTDWGTVTGGMTFRFKPDDNGLAWRFGLGYEREGNNLTLDGVQATKLSAYSSLNKGKYTELALGTNPANGILVLNEVLPAYAVYQAARLDVGAEWNPIKSIILVSSVSVIGSRKEQYYRAYNTATNTVWQETAIDDALSWSLVPRVSLSIPLGKKVRLTSQIAAVTPGSYTGGSETNPYDLMLSSSSTDGTVDLANSAALAFSYSFLLVIKP